MRMHQVFLITRIICDVWHEFNPKSRDYIFFSTSHLSYTKTECLFNVKWLRILRELGCAELGERISLTLQFIWIWGIQNNNNRFSFKQPLTPLSLKTFNCVLQTSETLMAIAVIAKDGNALIINMSVLNQDSNLFTSITARSLETILPHIIPPDQTGFIRQI